MTTGQKNSNVGEIRGCYSVALLFMYQLAGWSHYIISYQRGIIELYERRPEQ